MIRQLHLNIVKQTHVLNEMKRKETVMEELKHLLFLYFIYFFIEYSQI